MTIEATTGEWAWEVDQVGNQALPVQITLADGTHPDTTGWTWQAVIRTDYADAGGTDVATLTVDSGDTSGHIIVHLAAVDAAKLETGMLFELVQLTPTVQPWIRASLAVNRRVHV